MLFRTALAALCLVGVIGCSTEEPLRNTQGQPITITQEGQSALRAMADRGDITLRSFPADEIGEIKSFSSNGFLARALDVQSAGTTTRVPVQHRFRVADSPEKELLRATGQLIFVYAKPRLTWRFTRNGAPQVKETGVSDNGYRVSTSCNAFERTGGIMYVLSPENNYALDIEAIKPIGLIITSRSGNVERTQSLTPSNGEIKRVSLTPTLPRSDACYHKNFAQYRP